MNSIRRILPLATAAAFAAPLLAHEADNFKLLASDGLAGDAFGSAVTIQGTTAMVAAPLADGIGADSGAVYVFTFDGSAWNEVAKLTASNAAAGAQFGSAISLDGSRLVIGAAGANAGDGSAYAFSFDGVSWSEDSVLAPAGLAAGAGFGSSVDINGDSAVVGAPSAGAAYVFVDGLAGWTQEGSLSAAGSVVGDLFGAGVTINGDRIVVGAPNGNGTIANSGVSNAFTRSAGLWSEGQTLMLNPGAANQQYGAAVDMSDDGELLIGIPGSNVGGFESGGGARYVTQAGDFSLIQTFPGRDPDDRMGACVAINKRTSVLGVAGDDDEADGGGTAFRFLKNSITPLEIYVGHDNEIDDAFGSAVDVSDTWAVNGAPGHDAGLGAAYIHSTVQTVLISLLGSGLNPEILTVTTGPVIGQPMNMVIDLALFPESEQTRIVLKKNPLATPLVIAAGEVFFSLNDPIILNLVGMGSNGVNVPNNRAFLDGEFTMMGIVYGAAIDGFPILALTNGVTITVGTTDYPVNEEVGED